MQLMCGGKRMVKRFEWCDSQLEHEGTMNARVEKTDWLYPPTMRAALQACREAEDHPGTLVRVTCTIDQMDTALFASSYLANKGLLDFGKSLDHSYSEEDPVVMELTNGSAIEFVRAAPMRNAGAKNGDGVQSSNPPTGEIS